ncbi:unnamed protein product [Brassica rapa]|uniref:Reverse transcriptase zinc-binding domain-containing protein n=1 Tax=Brassica campestris TaxID=3711 RepID=A0A3P5YYK3_BRACM|nr:unnamed protein product [Brassica rapa]VDC68445.1 unnamed protein product [Brassica rapa]
MEVRNGQNTLFWHDNWSKFGCLKEVLGDRGCIALGILDQAVVADVLGNQRRRRRRRHRENLLNEVEAEIDSLQSAPSLEEDFPLWKQKEGVHAGGLFLKKNMAAASLWLLSM